MMENKVKRIVIEKEWKRLYGEHGYLLYEGYTYKGKPFGAGTLYYPDGRIYQEGIFDVKGFVSGREYYANGSIRFEGTYMINSKYGPNFPVYGYYYNGKGEIVFSGEFVCDRSSEGFPTIIEPKEFSNIIQDSAPEYDWVMWEDFEESIVDGSDYYAEEPKEEEIPEALFEFAPQLEAEYKELIKEQGSADPVIPEPKPVWEMYPGYSSAVILYHSFDFQLKNYLGYSKEERELVFYEIKQAHRLVLARMNESQYKELLQSIENQPDQIREELEYDWKYINEVFDRTYLECLKKANIDVRDLEKMPYFDQQEDE